MRMFCFWIEKFYLAFTFASTAALAWSFIDAGLKGYSSFRVSINTLHEQIPETIILIVLVILGIVLFIRRLKSWRKEYATLREKH